MAAPTIRRRVAALAVGLLLVAAACGGSSGGGASTAPSTTSAAPASGDAPHPATPHPVGTFGVGRIDETFVDGSRTTKAHGDQAEQPDRTLPTMVLYPTAPPDAASYRDVVAVEPGAPALGLPAPLIVFGHGSTRAGPDYLDTLASWASAGYVVAAPNFPLSTTDAPGGTDYGGIAEQTGDVSFVIDEVLAASADPDSPLAGTVDPDLVGLGGQSFGAITAIATGFNACCADDRIDAVTEFAGMWFDLGAGNEVAPGAADLPALFVHGEGDGVVPIAGDRTAASLAAAAGAPVQFLTLASSDHDAGYFGGLEPGLDALVTRATLAFYDQHLKRDPQAAARLIALVDEAGPKLATLTTP